MAKNNSNTTDLTKAGDNVPGMLSDDAFGDFLSGFASIDSVLLGDPNDGKQARYIGQLIGPGTPIEMEPDPKTGEVRTMKTFAFHPMGKLENGDVGPVMNVTHIIPASYIVANACERIHMQAEKEGKTAIVGFVYQGKGKTRRGFQLNKVQVFEKYV